MKMNTTTATTITDTDTMTDDDNKSEDEIKPMSLLPLIYLPGVYCQNEDIVGSGAKILKVDEEQLSVEPSLRSQRDDAELLLHIPFMETVTIQSIMVGRSSQLFARSRQQISSPPKTLKVFVDRNDIDFETARVLPAQATIELDTPPASAATRGAVGDIRVPLGRFRDVSSVTLFFANNHCYDDKPCSTEVTYVGFKGFCTHGKRLPVTYAIHSSQPRLERHEVHGPGIEAQEGMGFH